MTQLEQAKFNDISKEMEDIARDENLKPKELMRLIAQGRAVITASTLHSNVKPLGIGEGLRTKINANIGTSQTKHDIGEELEKLKKSESKKDPEEKVDALLLIDFQNQ